MSRRTTSAARRRQGDQDVGGQDAGGHDAGGQVSAGPGRRWAVLRRWAGLAWAVGVFAVLLGAYMANGDFLPGNDAKGNISLPMSLLKEGNLSFTPREMPFMFKWHVQVPPDPSALTPAEQALVSAWRERMAYGPLTADLDDWNWQVGGVTAEQLYRKGLLRPEPKYYVIESVRTAADGQRIYVNTFGPGAGLAALPVLAVVSPGGNVLRDWESLWYGAKLAAAMMVAGSGVFIFLTARLFTNPLRAAVLAAGYGLGTCVWAVSSQSLWQHGPNEFFLAMGTYFLFRSRQGAARPRWAMLCGAAYAAAVACRPTSVLVALAVGAYLLVVSRRALGWYVLGALPLAVALAGYNTYYLGAPWRFGQAQAGGEVAMAKTGSAQLWSTPLWEGAAGLLVSPSRGLLVFSPIVVLAGVGAVLALRRARRGPYGPLAPLMAGTLGLWVIAFKWFDWWGGWCYGYRPLVDTMPLLAAMAVPAMDWLFSRRWALAAAGVLLGWSVLVQVVGAFAYELVGWNFRLSHYDVYVQGQAAPLRADDEQAVKDMARTLPVVQAVPVRVDVDSPQGRQRLWSVRDNQILYHLRHFEQSRRDRKEMVRESIRWPSG